GFAEIVSDDFPVALPRRGFCRSAPSAANIRHTLREMSDETTADKIRIQYGGSVKPDNARELMSQGDIDGALVVGASLDARSFSQIVKAARDEDSSRPDARVTS